MAVQGEYIGWRIRRVVLPFVKIYGQWVEERIMPLAGQLTGMADAVEQQAYDEAMSQPVGDDYPGDGSEEAEYAFNVGLSFYENITGMYQGTLNLFAAGLFHLIEQQLADLTRDGGIQVEGIESSNTTLQNVIDWYQQHFQVDITQFQSWPLIEEMRLVANTTKHAEGRSATELRNMNERLFQSAAMQRVFPNEPVFHMPLHLPLGGDGLYITEADFRRYHDAAVGLFDWLIEYFQNHADAYYPH